MYRNLTGRRLALKVRRVALIMFSSVFLTNCDNNMTIEQQVDALYEKMSQEERVAQLRSTYMDKLFNEKGQLDTVQCRKLIPYGIGHFSQYASQKPTDANVLRDRVAAVQDWLIHHAQRHTGSLSRRGALGHQHRGCHHLSTTDRTSLLLQPCSGREEDTADGHQPQKDGRSAVAVANGRRGEESWLQQA